MPTPPTPADLWKQLAEEAGEDDTASAGGVSVSQAESDLRAAGFDVKAERDGANAWLADLAGETAPARDRAEATARVTGAPPPVRKSLANRRPVLIAAGIVALAAGVGILYALRRPVDVAAPRPSDTAPAPPPPEKPAPDSR